jgi:hypothetical protein
MVASARLRRVLASQAHRGRRLGMVPFFIIGVCPSSVCVHHRCVSIIGVCPSSVCVHHRCVSGREGTLSRERYGDC